MPQLRPTGLIVDSVALLAALACIIGGAWIGAAEFITVTGARSERPAAMQSARPFFYSEASQRGVTAAIDAHDAALRNRQPDQARAALDDAANRLRALLALTPTDGGLWALLADVEARRIGFSPRIVNYLDMSRTTGRLEFQAMARRISLGFRVWLALDAPARSALTGEAIRLLQPTTNHRLIAFLASVGAQTRGESAMALRGLVQERAPEWLEKYDAWLRSPPIF